MTDSKDRPRDPSEPGLIRGDQLANLADPGETNADEVARHPGMIRGDDLADGAEPSEKAAEKADEQAKHPGAVRGEDLAG